MSNFTIEANKWVKQTLTNMSNEKRFTFDKIEDDLRPTLFVLNDRKRFMGSIHCATHCIEDITDSLNQLEADKAELVRGLKDITRQFERVGRLYSLDQKAISAANALIQKHAAK